VLVEVVMVVLVVEVVDGSLVVVEVTVVVVGS